MAKEPDNYSDKEAQERLRELCAVGSPQKEKPKAKKAVKKRRKSTKKG
jgi:hypothetical protein